MDMYLGEIARVSFGRSVAEQLFGSLMFARRVSKEYGGEKFIIRKDNKY